MVCVKLTIFEEDNAAVKKLLESDVMDPIKELSFLSSLTGLYCNTPGLCLKNRHIINKWLD